MTHNRIINWRYILVFYLMAFLLSLPISSGYFSEYYDKITINTIFKGINFLPACIGTFVAAFFALRFDKSIPRTITFFGNNELQNIVITIVPLFVFTIAGLPNQHQMNTHLYAFVISMLILVYSFGEEIFWRGYLLNALSPLNRVASTFLLGILWWAWHFPFTSTFGLTTFLLIVLISSFLIGRFVESTQSYLTAAGLHSLVVVMNVGQNTHRVLILGGITILLWLSLGKLWKPQTSSSKT